MRQPAHINIVVEGATRIILSAMLLLVLEQCAGRFIVAYGGHGARVYLLALICTTAIFLFTRFLGNSDLIRDFSDLYLYDVVLQIFGIIFFYTHNTGIYHSASGTILLAKMVRFFWLMRSPSGDLIGWPIFGLIGYLNAREKKSLHRGTRRQTAFSYCCLLMLIPCGHFLAVSGYLESWALPLIAPGTLIVCYGAVYIRRLGEIRQLYSELAAELQKRVDQCLLMAQQNEAVHEMCNRLERERAEKLTEVDLKILRETGCLPSEIPIFKRAANGIAAAGEPEKKITRPALVWSNPDSRK